MAKQNKKVTIAGSEVIAKLNRLKRDKIILYNQTVLLRKEVAKLRRQLEKKANMAKKKSIWGRIKGWLGF